MRDKAHWDPSVLDCAAEDVEEPPDIHALTEANACNNLFDPVGDLKGQDAAYMTGLLSHIFR
jgi:hypothetical protein